MGEFLESRAAAGLRQQVRLKSESAIMRGLRASSAKRQGTAARFSEIVAPAAIFI
jgi:hypothetical protein